MGVLDITYNNILVTQNFLKLITKESGKKNI